MTPVEIVRSVALIGGAIVAGLTAIIVAGVLVFYALRELFLGLGTAQEFAAIAACSIAAVATFAAIMTALFLVVDRASWFRQMWEGGR